MAHKKGGGTARKNRDSAGKRLGVKLYGGQVAKPGNIILRQKGNKFFPGEGTMIGRDFTIFAIRDGLVRFKQNQGKRIVLVS
ncbi:50S ribosomal protein L27 [Candidatus Curtissbacteria bacterium RIFCSPLOWO2_01_FULL_38_11b]|uniref:Large ribosomal subunit protein bL27 n=1 Tax=Candidatus Curtissbacteria bacterium RIFCSPLOWO2_01_FULL_38_11b TaxID=1797725 RepID=A0A1F5GZG3_9BACT|nr:MAG: 50S ribosomal protein L27 [Candidatus Curtissbacteria bacterium RIFCSPLOWO2_01_FULL_38_11b]